MQTKYGRPKQLTDPYKDFEGYEDKLTKIINKKDEELNFEDFGLIFSMFLPAADYQEGLYFIPLCFEKMEKSCPFEENVCVSLFWYIGHFQDKLKEDGFYADCIREIESYFEMITKDFVVVNEYQPSLRYRLSKLKYGLTVERIAYGAMQTDETWKILSKLLFGLKDKGSIGSCWWIMVSYFVRDRISYAQKRSLNYRKEKIMFEHFHKFGEYSKHFEKARLCTQEKGTYSFLPQFAIIPFEIKK